MPREPKAGFEPFADDAGVQTVGGLSLENGKTRIALHGSVDLTRDREGLGRARALKAVLDAVVATLETSDLPDHVADDTLAPTIVRNPFA